MEKKGLFVEKLEPLFEKIEALPRPQRIALFVGIFVVIIFLFSWLIYFPKIAEIKKLGDEYKKVSTSLEKAKKQAAQLQAMKEKMKKAETPTA